MKKVIIGYFVDGKFVFKCIEIDILIVNVFMVVWYEIWVINLND